MSKPQEPNPPPKKVEKPKKAEKNKKENTDQSFDFLKSAIVPGWTQFSNGHEVKGTLWFLSFVSAAGALSSTVNKLNSSKNSYNTTSNLTFLFPDNLAVIGYLNSRSNYSGYKSEADNASKYSGLLAGIYIVNLIDAIFWSAPSKTVHWNDPKEGLQLFSSVNRFSSYNYTAIDKTMSIHYTWRF